MIYKILHILKHMTITNYNFIYTYLINLYIYLIKIFRIAIIDYNITFDKL